MAESILSRLADFPVSDFIYSSLSFVGERRGGTLPGPWFVKALGAIGIAEASIRQSLYRMERAGALQSHSVGRRKFYVPSASTKAIMETGRQRMRLSGDGDWDGEWTLVHIRFAESQAQLRDRVRDMLMVEGFGTLDPGLYIHPRDRLDRVRRIMREHHVESHLFAMRGRLENSHADTDFAREIWDFSGLAERYRDFVRRFEALQVDTLSDRDAFGMRFCAVHEYLRISWDDPDLPSGLLPDDWLGSKANRLIAKLYQKLEEPALRFADRFLS